MIKAYAVHEPQGELKPFEYDPGPLKDTEVEIDIDFCGICHSDVSMIDNEWGITQYPLVPGHEVVGTTRYHDIVASIDRVEIGYTWYAKRCQRTAVNTMLTTRSTTPMAEA